MSQNHSSFLKMIGMDGAEAAHDHIDEGRVSHSKTPTIELRAEAEMEEPQTASATEWDLEQQEQVQPEESTERLSAAIERTGVYTYAEHPGYSDGTLPTTEESYLDTTASASEDVQPEADAAEALNRLSKSETLMLSRSVHTQALEAQTKHTLPFTYEDGGAAAEEGTSGTAGTAHFDYDQNEADTAGSRIVVLEGKVNSKAFYLGNLPLRIGRDSLNEVSIDDANASRFHAEVREDELGRLIIVDLNSTNGVKVNGALVTDQVLQNHDVIQIGDALFEFLAPGVLSKGVPKTNVMEEASAATSEMQTALDQQKRRRRIKMYGALAVILILAGMMMGGKIIRSIGEGFKEGTTDILASKIEGELGGFRTRIENEMRAPVAQLDAEELRTAFLEKVGASSLAALIPDRIRKELENVPADVLKIFIEDSQLVSAMVRNAEDVRATAILLQEKEIELVKAGRLEDGLSLAEYILSLQPDNEEIKKLADTLRKKLGEEVKSVEQINSAEPTPGAAAGGMISPEDEQKFYDYMDSYQKKFDEYIRDNKADAAVAYGRLVKQKLEEIASKDENYERLMRSALDKWGIQVEELARDRAEQKKQEAKNWERRKEGTALLASIKMHLDLGDAGEARSEIEKFLKTYSDHPEAGEVKRLKKEQEEGIKASLGGILQMVEDYIRAENYESAWKEVYKFLEVVPNQKEALDLRAKVERVAAPKAVQFYNQARVFEFEADDLLAAEQSYKKAMEFADPRGDLMRKAQRRYEEVRRKNVR